LRKKFVDVPAEFYVGLQVGAHHYLVDYPQGFNEISTGPAHQQVVLLYEMKLARNQLFAHVSTPLLCCI
jgi:hypothetical protein